MPSRALQPLPTPLPSLDPAALDGSAAAAVREILAEAASANTTRSYASALRYWAAWFTGRYGRPLSLPLPEAVVVQFVVDHWARRSKAGLTWELPPALDAALVAGGYKHHLAEQAAQQNHSITCKSYEVTILLARGDHKTCYG